MPLLFVTKVRGGMFIHSTLGKFHAPPANVVHVLQRRLVVLEGCLAVHPVCQNHKPSSQLLATLQRHLRTCHNGMEQAGSIMQLVHSKMQQEMPSSRGLQNMLSNAEWVLLPKRACSARCKAHQQ